jgi:hypothetical protein
MLKLKFAHNKQSSKKTTYRIIFRLSYAVFVEICEFANLQINNKSLWICNLQTLTKSACPPLLFRTYSHG